LLAFKALRVAAFSFNLLLPPDVPQATLHAFPGHNVVTPPELFSTYNEQQVQCSTNFPKNVPEIVLISSENTSDDRSHAIPASTTTK
jgi:hypothetical protein